jgi:hypothetical protein
VVAAFKLVLFYWAQRAELSAEYVQRLVDQLVMRLGMAPAESAAATAPRGEGAAGTARAPDGGALPVDLVTPGRDPPASAHSGAQERIGCGPLTAWRDGCRSNR